MRSGKIGMIISLILVVFCTIPPASGSITTITSWHDTIAKGDTIKLVGVQALSGTGAVWVIGRNYFDIKPVTPDKQGNFSFLVKPDETRKFSSGQYAVLVQDPGMNGKIEIEPFVWDTGIQIADNGKIITDLGPKDKFPAVVKPQVDKIMTVAARPSVDDTFTTTYLYVEDPFVRFDSLASEGAKARLPSRTTGEKIVIAGTTNIGTENQLNVEIRNMTSNALITSGNIPVTEGLTSNQWAYRLPEPGLPKGEYTIIVQRLTGNPTGAAILPVVAELPTQSPKYVSYPGVGEGFGILFPLIISLGALAVIAVIIIASVRN